MINVCDDDINRFSYINLWWVCFCEYFHPFFFIYFARNVYVLISCRIRFIFIWMFNTKTDVQRHLPSIPKSSTSRDCLIQQNLPFFYHLIFYSREWCIIYQFCLIVITNKRYIILDIFCLGEKCQITHKVDISTLRTYWSSTGKYFISKQCIILCNISLKCFSTENLVH